MDRKTKKLITLNHALHPKTDVDKLYTRRDVGGGRMVSIEECVRIEDRSLSDHIKGISLNADSVLDDFVRDQTCRRTEKKKKHRKE